MMLAPRLLLLGVLASNLIVGCGDDETVTDPGSAGSTAAGPGGSAGTAGTAGAAGANTGGSLAGSAGAGMSGRSGQSGAAGDSAGGSAGAAGTTAGAAGEGGSAGDAGAAGSAGDAGAAGSGPAVCGGIFTGSTCGTCINTSCCDQSEACAGDDACKACIDDESGAGCSTNALFQQLNQCVIGSCLEACTTNACNPVTNAGCGVAGSACDVSPSNGFICYEPPNNKRTCGQSCGSNVGFCEGGYTCQDKVCMRYCCADADCGAGNSCDHSVLGRPDAGVCVTAGSKTAACQGLSASPGSACVPVDDLSAGGTCAGLAEPGDACEQCLASSCCSELSTCLAYDGCSQCVDGNESACVGQPSTALVACRTTKCAAACK